MIYLSAFILVLDQITKELIRHYLPNTGSLVPLCPVFNLSHVHNTGAAWGVMAGSSGLLVVVSIIAIILLVVCRRSLMEEGPLQRLAMASIMGGILGNLVDRIRLGFVVDFLDFHWGVHHFPSFNVADSAITCGVALYLIGSWSSARKGQPSVGSGQGTVGSQTGSDQESVTHSTSSGHGNPEGSKPDQVTTP